MKPKFKIVSGRPIEQLPRCEEKQQSFGTYPSLARTTSEVGMRAFSQHEYSDDGSENQSVQSLFARKQEILERVMSPGAFKKHLAVEQATRTKQRIPSETMYSKGQASYARKQHESSHWKAVEEWEHAANQHKQRCQQLQHENNLMQSHLAKANSKIRVMAMRESEAAVEIRNHALLIEQLRDEIDGKCHENEYLADLVESMKERAQEAYQERQNEQKAFSEAMEQMHQQLEKYHGAMTSLQKEMQHKDQRIQELEWSNRNKIPSQGDQQPRDLQRVLSHGSLHKKVTFDLPCFGMKAQQEEDSVRLARDLKKKDEECVVLEERLSETRLRLEEVLKQLQGVQNCKEERDQLAIRNEFLEEEIIQQMEKLNQVSLGNASDEQLQVDLDILKRMLDMARQQNDVLLQRNDKLAEQLSTKIQELENATNTTQILTKELQSLKDLKPEKQLQTITDTPLQEELDSKVNELKLSLSSKDKQIEELHRYASRLEDMIEETKDAQSPVLEKKQSIDCAIWTDETLDEHNPELLEAKSPPLTLPTDMPSVMSLLLLAAVLSAQ